MPAELDRDRYKRLKDAWFARVLVDETTVKKQAILTRAAAISGGFSSFARSFLAGLAVDMVGQIGPRVFMSAEDVGKCAAMRRHRKEIECFVCRKAMVDEPGTVYLQKYHPAPGECRCIYICRHCSILEMLDLLLQSAKGKPWNYRDKDVVEARTFIRKLGEEDCLLCEAARALASVGAAALNRMSSASESERKDWIRFIVEERLNRQQ